VNREAQESLIRETYLSAGLDFDLTRYAEAHGPGTEGDIVETEAFGEVFKSHRSAEEPLYVGSVKANIGHLEGTSGISSLVKVILMLEEGIIPRLANFEKLHPKILADDWNLRFPMQNEPWPTGTRRASINSFGFGGSNAHVVLDGIHEHPLLAARVSNDSRESPIRGRPLRKAVLEKRPSGNPSMESSDESSRQFKLNSNASPMLLIWSTADEGGMQRLAPMYSKYISQAAGKKDPSCDLKHLAHTLAFYRSRLPWSSFVIARSWSDLSKFETMFSKPVRSITEPKLVLIFNGQGTQYARMGLGLLENGVFRDSLDNFQQHLDKLGVSWDLIEEISRDPEHSKLHQAEYWQPICTALQIALVDLLKSYGVSPSAVLGHSSGEIAAAYSIRALSAESACRIAVYRGILAGKASGAGGKYGMMAVGLSKAEARSQLLMFGCQISEILIDIGCVNSSRNVTLTGDAGQLDLLSTILTEQSIFARRLDVNVAYHSRYMKAISAKYESLIGTLEGPATIQATAQMYSSVTAKSISVEELRTARYWVQNLESPVLFEPALKEMINNIPGIRASLEVGPHGVLRRAIKDTLIEIMRGEKIQCISTLDRNKNAAEAFLESIRKFHCLGFPIDLSQAISLRPGTKVECLTDLPEYPFDHSKTYWHESRLSKSHRFRKFARNDLLGSRVVDWNPLRPRWRNIIRALENPWIEDHRIGGALIYPGAGMLVMAIEAAAQYVRDLDDRQIDGFLLKEVVFLASLNVSLLPDGTETEIHLEPSSEKLGRSAAPARLDFHIYLLENEQWTETCCGKIAVQFREDESIHAHTERLFREKDCLSTLQSRTGICTSSLKNTKLYERFKAFGLDFGPTFQVFEDVRYDPSGGMASAGIKLGTWRLRGNPAHATRYVVHPTALDGALQLPVIALGAGVMKHVPTMVPSKIAWLWVSGCGLHSETQSKTVAAVAKAEYRGFRGTMSEVLVIDPVLQTPKIVIKGLETVIITSESDEENVPSRNMCFRMDWLPDLDMICPESLTRYIRGYTTTYHQVSVAKPDCELSPKKKGLYELERYLAILMHKDSALRMLEVASPSIGDVSDLVLWHLLRRKDGSDAAWDDSFAAYDIGIQREEIPQDLAAAIESISNDKRVGLRTVNVLKNKSARPAHSFKREETVLYGLVVAFLGKSAVMSQSKQFLRFMQPGGRLVIVTSCSISPSLEDIVTDAWLQNLETTRGSVEVELAMSCNVGRSNPIAQDSIALVVLRLVEPKPQQGEPMLSLTLLKMSGEPTDWASLSESLRDGLSRNNSVEVTVLDWKDYSMLNEHENQPQDLDIVCLSVLDATSLKDAGEDAFLALKALVARSKSILWVTCVVKNYNALGAGEECPPLHGMISGVGRTIRTEYPNLILVTLTLDTLINRELGTPSTITEITETILKVHQQMQTSPTHNYEPEYHYTHPNSTTPSLFLIPRLHRSHPLNTALTSSFTTPGPILQPFSTHTSLHLTTTSPGLLSTLLFQPFTPPPLPPTHIRIHPSHTGLNFLDLLTALGRIPHISVLGVEAAGTVTEAGSASDLPRGTRVAVLTDGTLRSSITAHYQTAVRIPDTLSFRDAASIPGTACTVYRALVDVARLQAGEGVLIHAGAGATGQMGIQLARHIGAEVFVTVGSEAKKGLVVETYGVDERNVLFSRDGSFVDGIKRRTGGRGVDVVLNCLSGGLLEEGWEGCVAPFGRWVEIGKRDVMGGSKLNMAPLARNVSFACVDLSGIWRERPSMMRELLENVFRLVVEGALKVVTPIREFSVCDVEGGFRSLQKGEEGGKVVIRMGGEEVVRILLPREPGWSLSWNRTYVICGGLGGLGRSVARWMVERGARHLILISRSGIGNDQVKQALVDELENRGCMVLTPKVDIADTAALAALLQHCATTLPHLAGCIQATMVLRVSPPASPSYAITNHQ
jgi:acyl transferase domain-containing protein/NADPH:quinone reductase-like Zn-dependent oxidoreductase